MGFNDNVVTDLSQLKVGCKVVLRLQRSCIMHFIRSQRWNQYFGLSGPPAKILQLQAQWWSWKNRFNFLSMIFY